MPRLRNHGLHIAQDHVQVICLFFVGIICLHPLASGLGSGKSRLQAQLSHSLVLWSWLMFLINSERPSLLVLCLHWVLVTPKRTTRKDGFENYSMPYKSTQPILSEHLLCAGGSDQGFTVPEKCDRYTCNPGGTTWHVAKGAIGRLPEGRAIHARPWGCIIECV